MRKKNSENGVQLRQMSSARLCNTQTKLNKFSKKNYIINWVILFIYLTKIKYKNTQIMIILLNFEVHYKWLKIFLSYN